MARPPHLPLVCESATSQEWLGLFIAASRHLPHAILVCDASRPGVPIMNVNVGFETLTGYKKAECVGRSCRFLQGGPSGVGPECTGTGTGTGRCSVVLAATLAKCATWPS